MFIHGLRYDPLNDSYHHDMEGNGVICSAVDILPTEFAKEVKYSDPNISSLLYIDSGGATCILGGPLAPPKFLIFFTK